MTIKTVLLAGAVALTPLTAQAEWIEHVKIDRMTGEKEYAAIVSPIVHPDKPHHPMFPAAIGGVLWVFCREAVLFSFVKTDTSYEPAYEFEFLNSDKVGIRWHAMPFRIEFPNSDELLIRAKSHGILHDHIRASKVGNGLFFAKIPAFFIRVFVLNTHAENLLLEIPTARYGDLYFSFDLAGARDLHDRTCEPEQVN